MLFLEQKWLQTDFREERVWKVAACWELSQAVLAFHHARDKREVCVRVGGRWAEVRPEHSQEMAETEEAVAVKGEPEESGVAARLKRRRRGGPDSPVKRDPAITAHDDGDAEHDEEMQVDADVELPLSSTAAGGPIPMLKEPDDDADKVAVERQVAAVIEEEGDDEDAVGEPMDEDEPAFAEPAAIRTAPVPPPTPASASPQEMAVADKKPSVVAASGLPLQRHDDLPTPPPDSVLHPSELAPGQTQTAAQAAAEAAQLKAERLAKQHGRLRSALATLAPSALTLDFAPFFDDSSSMKHGSGEKLEDDSPQTPPELSALALQELFGDITAYVPPTPLSPSLHAQGKIDRRIDDATASGGKLAHTSRLMDIRPVLVSTLNPGRKRKGERWDDLSDLWGGAEDLRDLAEMKGEVYSSGIRASP